MSIGLQSHADGFAVSVSVAARSDVETDAEVASGVLGQPKASGVSGVHSATFAATF